jgi:hypothetical protein
MIIDNTEQIKKLIANCGKDEFYMLQILHRAKDGKTPYEPEGKKISQQTVKTYYISSPEYLDYKMNEIRDLCKLFNARAYINLNKKSWRQISLKSLSILAGVISQADNNPDEWRSVKTIIDSACGQTGACDGNKTWVVDVDCKDTIELEKIKDVIRQCEPLNEEKIIATVPTLHGYHLISKPFNKAKFTNIYGLPMDIHDNNPTLLYVETKE